MRCIGSHTESYPRHCLRKKRKKKLVIDLPPCGRAMIYLATVAALMNLCAQILFVRIGNYFLRIYS